MSEQLYFASLPKLTGNPASPSSIPRYGEWCEVGTYKFLQEVVNDPEFTDLEALINPNTDPFKDDDFCELCEKKISALANSMRAAPGTPVGVAVGAMIGATGIPVQFLKRSFLELMKDIFRRYEDCKRDLISKKEKLEATHQLQIETANRLRSQGYLLIRDQRWEYIADWAVAEDDSLSKKYIITQGITEQDSSSVEGIIGLKIGREKKTSTEVCLELLIKPKILGVESQISASASGEWSETEKTEISKSLKVATTTQKVISSIETSGETYTANGGEKGARLILWQLVDRFRLIRKFDEKRLSEHFFRHSKSEFSKYSFQ